MSWVVITAARFGVHRLVPVGEEAIRVLGHAVQGQQLVHDDLAHAQLLRLASIVRRYISKVQSTAGLILGAGLGTRFGGRKLLAPIDGQPMLQHVLDLAADVELGRVVVVLGTDG